MAIYKNKKSNNWIEIQKMCVSQKNAKCHNEW
jgi:hypothetical protein